jgi:hypothetical protein
MLLPSAQTLVQADLLQLFVLNFESLVECSQNPSQLRIFLIDGLVRSPVFFLPENFLIHSPTFLVCD